MKKDKISSWEEAVSWLKNQPDQKEFIEACFYDDPLINAAYRYYKSSEWEAIRSYLPKEKGKALDIGAGRGISSYALAMDGWSVQALEPDNSMLVGTGAIRTLAWETDLDISVEENTGETLSFKDNSFDLVFSRQVLHHANNLKYFCLEASRVLKPGGLFIAIREHVISNEADLESFLYAHPLHELYGGEYAYKLNEYKHAICQSGIKLSAVLNPYQSDINLYPETIDDVKQRVGSKIGLPGSIVPKIFLKMLGAMNQTPGRLYSFVGIKQ